MGAGNTNRARRGGAAYSRRGDGSSSGGTNPYSFQATRLNSPECGPRPPAGPLPAPPGRHPAPPERPGRSTSRLRIGCAGASGRRGAELPQPEAGREGRKNSALRASFVTSRGSDNPFHSERAAHWFHGPASRDRACSGVEGGASWRW